MRLTLISLLVIGCLICLPLESIAQNAFQEVPVDSKLIKGKLENGLTYYIRKNKKPENKAELRLVVNAGSVLENDQQQGLAHFMEHMCFNGTKNFEKNELVSYLQTIGVRFGAHLNAYTSFDETVYMLSIPTDDEDIVNKGFQILEDWAHQVSLEEEEIEKERGVVIEEWRIGRGAQQRLQEQYMPVIFHGSRYAERLPIGKKEIIENFDHETLRNFYRDWYRPDLMAVVVVGDIDVDSVEDKIKQHFGTLSGPENPKERISYDLPNHDSTLFTIASDKEQAFSQVMLLYKHDGEERTDQEKLKADLLRQLYSGMINSRLQEIGQQANPPFIFGASAYGELVRGEEVYQSIASVSDTTILRGLQTLVRENERVKRHGFTQAELERIKSDIFSSYERAFNERDKSESSSYASQYISNFLSNEPIPGIEYEYEFVKQELPNIDLKELNELADKWLGDQNRVIVITGPEKEGVDLPEEEEVLKLLAEVEQEEINPYKEKEIAKELISTLPKAGKIRSERTIAPVNATEVIFENGLTVVLKPTDYKNDEILMKGVSKGGHSLYELKDYYSAITADQIVAESGIGQFSATDLQKFLAGKNVYVQPYISQISEGISGSVTPKDIRYLLELTHLFMGSPRRDSSAFQSFINKQKSLLQNLMADPSFYFSDKVSRLMSQNHPRGGGLPLPEELDKVSLDKSYAIFEERFEDISDFTFFFVGNFDPDTLIPLLSVYLGSLEGDSQKENYRDLGIRPPSGLVKEEIYKGSDPKSLVRIYFTGELDQYNDELNYQLRSLGEILNVKLIELLREEQSGVYTVGASAYATEDPYPSYQLQISFPCSPDNVESLIETAFSVIKSIQTNGPDSTDVNKIKETQRRDLQVSKEQNRFWLNYISNFYWDGEMPKDTKGKEERIETLTGDMIQKVAKEYIHFDQFAQFVLLPEELASKPLPEK